MIATKPGKMISRHMREFINKAHAYSTVPDTKVIKKYTLYKVVVSKHLITRWKSRKYLVK